MFSHMPSRRSQPYGRSDRPETPQLSAMLRGGPLTGANPMDHQRKMQRLVALLLGHH